MTERNFLVKNGLECSSLVISSGGSLTFGPDVTVNGLNDTVPFPVNLTTPVIWNQSNDTYYEFRGNSLYSTFTGPSNAASSSGYITQPDLRVQSYMRRVTVHPSGYVTNVLDGDDSNLVAGDWVRIYEGETKVGNGTTNQYIRAGVAAWSEAATYNYRDRVVSEGSVWESVSVTPSGVPASGTISSANLIASGTAGNVMVEVPEFYVRADVLTPYGWKNSKNQDVTVDNKILTDQIDNVTAEDSLRIIYVLPKGDYDNLSNPEKDKFARHPAFWTNYDSEVDRTLYVDGVTATTLSGNPYISERDNGGYTRVFDGTQYNYWTISGTAAASGDFDTSTAIRYRYLPAYQGTTDGTVLQSLSGSGVYTTHTRATGRGRARAIASGWSNGTYAVWNAAQVLTLTEYRNFYIQDPTVGIGRGRDNFNSLAGYRDYPLGILNTEGNKTANNTTNGQDSTAGSDRLAAMQWRGIEHYYAATWRWWDGFNVNSGNVYLSLNPDLFADDTATNYTSVGSIATNLSSSYQGGFTDDIGLFFLPEAGGTASTYVTDAAWSSTGWRVLLCGGSSGIGAQCGPWAFFAHNTSSSTGANVGSALVR